MPKTFSINIRVSRQQKDLIENNAQASGYKNTSDYMRTRSLCFLACEEKLGKICNVLFPEDNHKIKPNGANKKLAEFI